MKNVQYILLVESKKLLLTDFPFKLGPIKNLMKILNKTKATFKYVPDEFLRLNEAKINKVIFAGLQIRKHLLGGNFGRVLRGKGKNTRKTYK